MSYYILEEEGKSRSDAEASALNALGASRAEVKFEETSSNRGIMGLLKRDPSLIRVFPGENLSLEAHARGVLLTVVRKLGVEAEIVNTGEKDENLYIELSSEDSGFLIGKHGRTLDAVQFLVNLIVNTHTKSGRRIMVDVEQYRDRREKSLIKLAKRMAERVARSGRTVALNYMNPYERRIIHLALEEDSRVYTESDGNGVYKRVKVIPTERKESSGSSRGGRGRSRGGRGRGGGGNRGGGNSEHRSPSSVMQDDPYGDQLNFAEGEEPDGNRLEPGQTRYGQEPEEFEQPFEDDGDGPAPGNER